MLIALRHPKNTALKLQFPIFDAEWAEYITSAADLDSEKSQNGGSFSDLTNEATEVDATGVYTLDLTTGEMNYGTVFVKITTTTDGAKVPCFLIKTYAENSESANTELSSVPTTTSSLREMIQWMFGLTRNKRKLTSGTETAYKEDASTPLGTASWTDDGSTSERGEFS